MDYIIQQLKNSHQLKIDAVLGLHVAWLALIYLTWPVLFFRPAFNKFYFPVMVITLLARTVFKGDCILTNIENDLRRKYSPETVYNDTDKCIPYYSEKWVGFRIGKPVIVSVFSSLFLLSLFIFVKNLI